MADSFDPASVNDGKCVAMMGTHSGQPQVMTDFSDPDNDGDAGGDTDCDGDGGNWTTPPAPHATGGR